MAATDTYQCRVITPERTVLDCAVRSTSFTAYDGERGVLRNHAPLTGKLGIGVLRADAMDGRHVFFIDGGFAQVVDNELTVLTEQAIPQSDIDADAARKALAEAQAMKITDAASLTARTNALARASAQLKLAAVQG